MTENLPDSLSELRRELRASLVSILVNFFFLQSLTVTANKLDSRMFVQGILKGEISVYC
jgi:hypothetical protein